MEKQLFKWSDDEVMNARGRGLRLPALIDGIFEGSGLAICSVFVFRSDAGMDAGEQTPVRTGQRTMTETSSECEASGGACSSLLRVCAPITRACHLGE